MMDLDRQQAARLYDSLVSELRAFNTSPAVTKNALAMVVGALMATETRTDREAAKWAEHFGELMKLNYERSRQISARHKAQDEIVKIDLGTY